MGLAVAPGSRDCWAAFRPPRPLALGLSSAGRRHGGQAGGEGDRAWFPRINRRGDDRLHRNRRFPRADDSSSIEPRAACSASPSTRRPARSTSVHISPRWALGTLRGMAIPHARLRGVWRGESALLTADGKEMPTSQVVLAQRDQTGNDESLCYDDRARHLRPEELETRLHYPRQPRRTPRACSTGADSRSSFGTSSKRRVVPHSRLP